MGIHCNSFNSKQLYRLNCYHHYYKKYLQSALDRERNRSANLSAALDLARAQALEEVENERRLVSQLKREIKSKQVCNLIGLSGDYK